MKTQITITLPENEAWTLALMLKRITWEGVRDCAVDKAETEHMIGILENCRNQLDAQGIAPQ